MIFDREIQWPLMMQTDLIVCVFFIQYKAIPGGLLPPSTPKFAYGQVPMKKVSHFLHLCLSTVVT